MDSWATISDAGTIPAQLTLLSSQFGDIYAVIGPEGRCTYTELAARVADTAHRLQSVGIAGGDRVGIFLPNGLRWVISALAIQSLGAVAVPMNTWSKSTEIRRIAEQTCPRMVITSDSILGKDPRGLLGENGLPVRLGNTHAPYIGTVVWPSTAPHPAFSGGATPAGCTRPGDTTTALLLSTSGSTSTPKLVPLLHGGLLRNGAAIGDRQGIRPGDRIWFGGPLFFSYGCANALPTALTHAATLCLQEGTDGNDSLALIERERCTIYYGFGPTTRKLVEASDFGKRDISSLRSGTTGFSVEEKALAREVLGVGGVCSVYGMTEAYGHSAMTRHDDDDAVFYGTQGQVLPTQELRIARLSDGSPAAVGEDGEIQLRGTVTPCYIGVDPAGTFTPDGWLHTGDLGHLDDSGRLVFTDRMKSLLKLNGINVSPAEIESVLVEHHDVEQAYVFGEYVDGAQRAVAALVVRRGCRWDELPASLSSFIRERAASYKVPSRFVKIESAEVPMTDTGKINKRALAERLIAAN